MLDRGERGCDLFSKQTSQLSLNEALNETSQSDVGVRQASLTLIKLELYRMEMKLEEN